MKKLAILIFVFLGLINQVKSQQVQTIGAEQLENILENSADTLFVINFWATWCGPCVTELPYFEEISDLYTGEKVKILLISLDFPGQKDTRLIPFIREKEIQLEVVLLNELDYGKWMPSVDQHWKGNLPATLVYNNNSGKRQFIPNALKKEEIIKLIDNNL